MNVALFDPPKGFFYLCRLLFFPHGLPTLVCRGLDILAITMGKVCIIFLFEICLTRYLYHNIWSNVGIAYDAFWTHWLKVFNVAMTAWLLANAMVSNEWYFQIELGICMRKNTKDIPSLMGEKVENEEKST